MHGTPFRRAVEEGLLDPKHTVQIGIRGAQNSDEGWTFSLEGDSEWGKLKTALVSNEADVGELGHAIYKDQIGGA